MDVAIRALVAFLFLLLVTRIVGRRELSSLEPFDVILLVVMGDLIQQGVTQADDSVTGITIAVGVFALMAVATSYASFRFKRLRPVLDGEPVILLQDGKLIERNVRNERLTEEEIAQEARLQQIASLDKVAWAVLESSGKISFIPKS
ncbi:MAG: YetF domain-containing protein [Actinomycetota bacterium]